MPHFLVSYFAGDGSRVAASTCEGTDFATQISVFTGECRADLDCVDGSDRFCGDQSVVEWNSAFGARYYIFVHGYLQSHGNFHLSLYHGLEEIGQDLRGDGNDWECDDVIDEDNEDEKGNEEEHGHCDGKGNWINIFLFGGF
jgi:hypothetical protein